MTHVKDEHVPATCEPPPWLFGPASDFAVAKDVMLERLDSDVISDWEGNCGSGWQPPLQSDKDV